MICLPSVSTLQGMCLMVPKDHSEDNNIKTMFESLGGCIECESEEIMRAMMVPTGLMGPMYAILQSNRDWLVEKGVPPGDASFFLAKLYLGMMLDAEKDCHDPERFDNLIDEQTPGGLNEQSIENLKRMNAFDSYRSAMDSMLSRLEGKTDGYVDNT
uniref:Pyrroline-5-carboxylate reductase dimerisation domain-containing protein n=1 Tax=Proboscia inermis TaxID=420281 RepID=A0A7S0C8H3_9STRA|mmetsp:Transcript_34125/g.34327  ORF Transcript_34125/g.34327 Transcript_34125/m.34327 type:complete len:157 (+) Transcript_34125:119-589(+)